MGEAADAILDGDICQFCGEWIDPEVGECPCEEGEYGDNESGENEDGSN